MVVLADCEYGLRLGVKENPWLSWGCPGCTDGLEV